MSLEKYTPDGEGDWKVMWNRMLKEYGFENIPQDVKYELGDMVVNLSGYTGRIISIKPDNIFGVSYGQRGSKDERKEGIRAVAAVRNAMEDSKLFTYPADKLVELETPDDLAEDNSHLN